MKKNTSNTKKSFSQKLKALSQQQQMLVIVAIVVVVILAISVPISIAAISNNTRSGTFENEQFVYSSDRGKITIKSVKTATSDIVFPGKIDGLNVVGIAAELFKDNDDIRTVTFGRYINEVGDSAFEGCARLKTVVMNENNIVFGENVFKDCNNLEAVTLGEKMESIAEGMFENCDSLVDIELPETVLTIKERAFYDCYKLKNVNFPNSIENIGGYAFALCSNLLGKVTDPQNDKVEISRKLELPKNLKNIGEYAFKSVSSGYVGVIFNDELQIIGEGAFEKNSYAISELVLPNKLTTIGAKAFRACPGIGNQIVFPQTLVSIGGGAFSGISSSAKIDTSATPRFSFVSEDKSLRRDGNIILSYTQVSSTSSDSNTQILDVPEGIVRIAEYACFNEYSYITVIKLPTTLKSLGTEAFYSLQLSSNDARQRIVFSSANCEFGDKVFYLRNNTSDGDKGLLIEAYPGGNIETFAKANSSRIEFLPIK